MKSITRQPMFLGVHPTCWVLVLGAAVSACNTVESIVDMFDRNGPSSAPSEDGSAGDGTGGGDGGAIHGGGGGGATHGETETDTGGEATHEDEHDPPPQGCTDCDDDNPCTEDRCTTDGSCVHVPIEDAVLSCSDEVTLSRCDAGVNTQLPCAHACAAHGYDTYGDCDPLNIACMCGNSSRESCTPGEDLCLDGDTIGGCVAAAEIGTSENMWRARDCVDVCVDAGYGAAVGCAFDAFTYREFVCYCSDACDPECPAGYYCAGGQCYRDSDPSEDLGDNCASDIHCPDRMRCQYSTGRCYPVECTRDGHCPWCSLCMRYACSSCLIREDGSCSCY